MALINRAAPRDLFDLSSMLRFGLFDDSEQELLRKCVIFYSAIGSETVPTGFSFENIEEIPQNKIKTDLLPVLRNSRYFDVKTAQTECMQYFEKLLRPTEKELAFWAAFREKQYRPELLFSDADILERVGHHQMAVWKCN
ncbi:MAG TPA: hypothetical protein P5127_02935 [Oscillospiraceae bacterium]|nr:hypothetical protein [Oscillospiraceae bacterium]